MSNHSALVLRRLTSAIEACHEGPRRIPVVIAVLEISMGNVTSAH